MFLQSSQGPTTPLATSLRSRGSDLAVADDALDLQEIMDSPVGIFAPVAGLLVAAERREGVPGRIVDLHLAGAKAAGDAARMLDILRLHQGGEAVHRVIGDLHRLLLI